MKTYLVTGGAGFIGSNYIQFLFEQYGDDIVVINVDKLTYAGNLENLKLVEAQKNYIFKQIDICDKEEIGSIFRKFNVDYVINFAAESHVDRSIVYAESFVRTNILGTQVLLDACKKAWYIDGEFLEGRKFLQISTDEVYGSLPKTGLFREDTPLNPHSPYSATKAAADMLVKAYCDTYKFPANITRSSNNYGPHQNFEKLIPLLIKNAINHNKLPLYGDGLQIRDWLYVGDNITAIEKVLKLGKIGQVYNVGGNCEMENITIANNIIDILKDKLNDNKISNDLIAHVEDRLGHDRRYALDANKIKVNLGWNASVKFEDGIIDTIEWYIANLSYGANNSKI